MPGKLTRRNILALGTCTAALTLVGPRFSLASAPFDSDQFIDLSARLLELDRASLDEDIAEQLLSALIANGKEAALKALAAGHADRELGQEIVIDWFSGVCKRGDVEEVVTYTDALVWDALDYTKPQGVCGGDTGYWAAAPGEI